jgi:hypothetical protein
MKTVVSFALALIITLSASAFAQAPAPTGTLVVTVVDTTGAVLPGATITLTGIDPNNKATTIEPAKATDQGVATIVKLAPGRYALKAEFGGFETRTIPEVRVRNGNNKQVAMLAIEGHKETVEVGIDKQSAAADPRGPSFGSTLTREQIEQLSDDPDILRQQLQDMAGPGAVIRVDSFEGGALPSKSQIRSIRISRDQFAAEFHAAGGVNIEIITQPGAGPIRMGLGYQTIGDSFTGRSPFTPVRGPEADHNVNLNVNGTLVKNKSSFGLFVNNQRRTQTPNINIATSSDQRRAEALALRQKTEGFNANLNIDYAITLDQTLRFAAGMNTNNNQNLGIGTWDLEERAYQRDSTNGFVRMQQIGPLGRRGFLRTRLQYAWTDTTNTSATEAQTIRVLDSFNSGGAQLAGGQHGKTIVLGSDLDYVRGINTWRFGVQADASRWQSDDRSNYLGTYTFESFDAFTAGRPRSYTRRIGDPNLSYNWLQAGIYAQDDVRVRRNLTLSGGVRYEAQTHINDYDNIMPRLGITWAIGKQQSPTTVRASWGIFHDWLSNGTYEQTLRVDGFRQQEIDIFNPAYPVFNDLALVAAPVSKYVLGEEVVLPRTTRVSLGVDRRFKVVQASATYAYQRGGAVARGVNLNAPINGVRPDLRFGNVIEVESDASSRLNQLQANISINQGALIPLNRAAPKVSLKRVTWFINYTAAKARNNTDGAFNVAPTGDLDLEWGPANNDVRHRFNVQFNNQIVKNLGIGLGFNVNSASPYTIRTGFDENADLIFNDRPAGVGRNTERGSGSFNLNMNLNYRWQFGKPVTGPGGIGVIFNGGAVDVRQVEAPGRYSVGFFMFANNLTNHANYVGYSGVMTSQYFRQATAVSGTRRVQAGLQFLF